MKKGMAAIITVIVLGATMALIGGVMTLSSITDGQETLMETKVKKNQNLLEACMEESIYWINYNNTLPAEITTTFGSCEATVNSHVGASWDLSIGVSGEMSPLGINVVLNRGTTIVISTWLDQ